MSYNVPKTFGSRENTPPPILLENAFFRPPPSHGSDPRPREENQTDSVARPSESDQAHITAPLSFQYFSGDGDADQSARANAREARGKVPPIVLGPAQLAGADGTERDVAAGREAEKQGEGYDEALFGGRRRYQGCRKPEGEDCY